MPRLISSLPLEIEIMSGVSPNEALFLIGALIGAYSVIFLPKLMLVPVEIVSFVLNFISDRVFTRPEPKPVRRRINR